MGGPQGPKGVRRVGGGVALFGVVGWVGRWLLAWGSAGVVELVAGEVDAYGGWGVGILVMVAKAEVGGWFGGVRVLLVASLRVVVSGLVYGVLLMQDFRELPIRCLRYWE